MPLFGAHMSIAGGLERAVDAAAALGMATVQIFTRSPSQWAVPPADKNGHHPPAKPLGEEEIRRFRDAVRTHGLTAPTAHDSYLINLAAPDEALRRRSIEAFADEMDRAEALGLDFLVFHPGTPTDGDEDAGLSRIAACVNEVARRTRGYRVAALLETTAGQGRSVGHRFEHLARIRDQLKSPERVGVCLDTCHVLAAGYPLSPESAYRATFDEFDRVVGIEHLKAFHVNDSKKPLGSRVDRHEHLGKGFVGLEAFRLLVTDPRFSGHPMYLETPKEGEMDPVNLAVLEGLVDKRARAKRSPPQRRGSRT